MLGLNDTNPDQGDEAHGGGYKPATATTTPTRLTVWKDATGTIQSIATVIALIAAGVWFILQGIAAPHATFEHTVQSLKIHDHYTVVALNIHIKNVGQIPLKLRSGTVYIQRVLPLVPTMKDVLDKKADIIDAKYMRVIWPVIRTYDPKLDLTIWPGESEDRHYDFLVPSDVCEVGLHSYFHNAGNEKIGWAVSTFYNIKECPK